MAWEERPDDEQKFHDRKKGPPLIADSTYPGHGAQ